MTASQTEDSLKTEEKVVSSTGAESCHLQKYSDDSAAVGCISNGREAEYINWSTTLWHSVEMINSSWTQTKQKRRNESNPVSAVEEEVEVVENQGCLHEEAYCLWWLHQDVAWSSSLWWIVLVRCCLCYGIVLSAILFLVTWIYEPKCTKLCFSDGTFLLATVVVTSFFCLWQPNFIQNIVIFRNLI